MEIKGFIKWLVESDYYKDFFAGIFGAIAFALVLNLKGKLCELNDKICWINYFITILIVVLIFFVGAITIYSYYNVNKKTTSKIKLQKISKLSKNPKKTDWTKVLAVWTIILAIATILLVIFNMLMALNTKKSVDIQLSAPPKILLYTNKPNNFIDLRFSSDGYKDYILYIYNSGKAPCFDLEIKNIKYADAVYKILDSNEISPMGENYTKTKYLLLNDLRWNRGCWNILYADKETYCNYYLGLIKPSEIIALAVDVDIKRFTTINKDKPLNFEINASCLVSNVKLPIKMVYSDFVG